MNNDLRMRRHDDGRLAVYCNSRWLITTLPDNTDGPQWFDDDQHCSDNGWSELFVAELPTPDDWVSTVNNDGEDVRTPTWFTSWQESVTAWIEGVETPAQDLTEDLDAIRSDALKMLAAADACEQYRTKQENAK